MGEKANISIEEVMDRIKQAMKSIKVVNEESASSVVNNIKTPNSNEIESKLSQMDVEIRNNNLRWNIATEWLITSHRRMTGRFIVLGKKIVRKLLRWYIHPLFDQQREFNGSVTRSLNLIGDILKQNVEFKEQISTLGLMVNENIMDLPNKISTFDDLFAKHNDELQQQIEIHKGMILEQKADYESQLTTLNNTLLQLGKTLIYTYADKDAEIALALAVEFNRVTGNQEFMDLTEQLNQRLVNKELHL